MRHILTVLAILLLAACETTPIRPLQGNADTRDLAPEEQRLWHSAAELDEQLERADYLYEDAELQAYLDSVMLKLYPEYNGSVTVRIVDRCPECGSSMTRGQ